MANTYAHVTYVSLATIVQEKNKWSLNSSCNHI